MSKIFLQDSFKEFCEINKFEVNAQQVKIINSLEKFLGNRETMYEKYSNNILSTKNLEENFYVENIRDAVLKLKYLFEETSSSKTSP